METLFVVDDIADSFDYKNKWAIIQYLKDIEEIGCFRLLVLTHNFDFYRSVMSRKIVGYSQCLMAIKTEDCTSLERASGISNVFVNDWKEKFYSDRIKRIACISFLRNIVEYTRGVDDIDYLRLTSLLHRKSNSDSITESDLDAMFARAFGTSGSWSQPGELVMKSIEEGAEACLSAPTGANFENKIVLAIGIRIAAEAYIIRKLGIADADLPTSKQTHILVKWFCEARPGDVACKVLREVEVMTPESIHLNSFMYEPIIDMSDVHLRSLYTRTVALV